MEAGTLKNRLSRVGGITITISIAFAVYIAVNYGFAIDLFSMVVSDMRHDIGFSYTAVGTVSAFVRGGFLAASLLSMFIIPVIGAGRLVVLSVAVCTICFWGMAFAGNVWVIGGIMTLIGACAATVYIPMVEVVGRFVGKAYHGRVIGFICGGQSLGVMGASLMVPYFVTHHTWRWAWMAVGLIALALLAATCPALRRIGVFAPGAGKTHFKEESGPDRVRITLTPGTLLVLALYFLSAFSFNPFQTYLSPYFRDELGFTVETAATVWSCIALPGVVAGLLMGYVADRINTGFSLIVAYAATLTATLILLVLPHTPLLIPAGLLFGLAFYSVFGLIPAYISKVNPPKTAVKIFALANIAHGAGGISGNFIGGWLKDATQTFQWLYWLIAATLMLLILLSRFLPGESSGRHNSADTGRTPQLLNKKSLPQVPD